MLIDGKHKTIVMAMINMDTFMAMAIHMLTQNTVNGEWAIVMAVDTRALAIDSQSTVADICSVNRM